jgi:hypothetical protein
MGFDTRESMITELMDHTVNEGKLYPLRQRIEKNLATKKARGIYDHDLAVKAYAPFVEAGAKTYAKDHGGNWYQFDVPTRRAVAEELVEHFEIEYSLGNFNHLLPAKYQNKSKTAHARKAGASDAHVELHSPSALRASSDRQLRQFYREEKHDVAKARAEADRRGISLHARRKQLDRDIARVVPSWSRGGR